MLNICGKLKVLEMNAYVDWPFNFELRNASSNFLLALSLDLFYAMISRNVALNQSV